MLKGPGPKTGGLSVPATFNFIFNSRFTIQNFYFILLISKVSLQYVGAFSLHKPKTLWRSVLENKPSIATSLRSRCFANTQTIRRNEYAF